MSSLNLIGTIEEIQETKTYPKKDGTGNVDITKLKISGKYFTSFAKEQLTNLQIGSEVDVTYTSVENTFEGKTYINNNISVVKLKGEEVQLSPDTQAKIDATKKVMDATGGTNATDPNFASNVKKVLSGCNTVNVGDKTFKVTLEEI